jgi:hypothetical protein
MASLSTGLLVFQCSNLEYAWTQKYEFRTDQVNASIVGSNIIKNISTTPLKTFQPMEHHMATTWLAAYYM